MPHCPPDQGLISRDCRADQLLWICWICSQFLSESWNHMEHYGTIISIHIQLKWSQRFTKHKLQLCITIGRVCTLTMVPVLRNIAELWRISCCFCCKAEATPLLSRGLSAMKKLIDSAPGADFPAAIGECKGCASKLGKQKQDRILIYIEISQTLLKSIDSQILTRRQIFSQLSIILISAIRYHDEMTPTKNMTTHWQVHWSTSESFVL